MLEKSDQDAASVATPELKKGSAENGAAPVRALRSRGFRLLWIGQGTSLLGDQFAFIALPWLVLLLTPDPLALGLVLALSGIPRALAMLVGGAASDRLTPRVVMLGTDIARFALVFALAVLAFLGSLSLWLLCIFVGLFGFLSGLFMPASSSIMPRLVAAEGLRSANAVFQGTAQITVFLGPVLAGWLIAFTGSRAAGAASAAARSGLRGIALAFAVDGLTFIVSIITLWAMGARGSSATGRMQQEKVASALNGASGTGVLAAVAEGFRYVMRDPFLRGVLVIVAAMNFLFVGPLFVGLPILAKTRFPEGAAAFGLAMSGYGGGNLGGYLLAGVLSRVKKRGSLFMGVIAVFGIGTASLGILPSAWAEFFVLFVLGIGNGLISVVFITRLQLQTDAALLGRVMSLLLLATVGLVPISQALVGLALRAGTVALFVAAGFLMIVTALLSLRNATIRNTTF